MNEPLLESLYEQLNKDPHKVLYVSVILQAFLDLFKEKRSHEASSITLERDQAKAWFFASVGVTSEDFEIICTHAGLEPHKVRSFALKVIETGDQENVRRRINTLL
jgi:hypothetical protein